MKTLIGLIIVIALACVGCADDETTPADGGTDAVADMVAGDQTASDAVATETSDPQDGAAESAPADATAEATIPEDSGTDIGEDQ
jgi:hypothetical protein